MKLDETDEFLLDFCAFINCENIVFCVDHKITEATQFKLKIRYKFGAKSAKSDNQIQNRQ